MGARKEARDRKHMIESLDGELLTDPHAGCKREEAILRNRLFVAEDALHSLESIATDLEKTKAAFYRLRAENRVMKQAIILAAERAKRLETVEHRYGAKIVLLTLKKHMW